jgi:hypothetical protein
MNIDTYMARIRFISRTTGWCFVVLTALAIGGIVVGASSGRSRLSGGELAGACVSGFFAYRALSRTEYKSDGFPVVLGRPGYVAGVGIILAAAALVAAVSAVVVGRDDLLTGVVLLQGAIALGTMGFIAVSLVALFEKGLSR